MGRIGSVQFQLFGPDQTQFLNYIRTIEATHTGQRWTFHQSGQMQRFEHPDRYSVRSIPARFTPELLDEYCQAVGIHYFDHGFYGSQGILIESKVRVGPDVKVMSLAETRHWLGIVSGVADSSEV